MGILIKLETMSKKTEREKRVLMVDQTFNRSEIAHGSFKSINPSRELSKDGRVAGFIHVGSFRLNGFLGFSFRGLHTR